MKEEKPKLTGFRFFKKHRKLTDAIAKKYSSMEKKNVSKAEAVRRAVEHEAQRLGIIW